MSKKLRTVIAALLTISLPTRSTAEQEIKNKICFERESIEEYKTYCESCDKSLFETELSLNECLADMSPKTEWYQEKPFVIFLGSFAAVMTIFAFKNK